MKPYQHILVLVEFTQASHNSILRALDLAKHYQAKVSLLHIVEDLSLGKVAFGGTKTLPMNATAKQNQISLAEDKLKHLAEVNELPANTALSVQHGKVEEVISQYIKQYAVDLLVLCAMGKKTGLGHLSLDTLTKQLPCEVLGIRPNN